VLRELLGAVGNSLIDFVEFLSLLAIRSEHKHTAHEVRSAFLVSEIFNVFHGVLAVSTSLVQQLFDKEETGFIPADVFREAMQEMVRPFVLAFVVVFWSWHHPDCFQTEIDPVELELLMKELAADSPDPTMIDYEAFVTKVMST
jgi:Ca2+-binding EF-hand superfamily protein